jgi:hypothetical protein
MVYLESIINHIRSLSQDTNLTNDIDVFELPTEDTWSGVEGEIPSYLYTWYLFDQLLHKYIIGDETEGWKLDVKNYWVSSYGNENNFKDVKFGIKGDPR